jgi:hypothetical protein
MRFSAIEYKWGQMKLAAGRKLHLIPLIQSHFEGIKKATELCGFF